MARVRSPERDEAFEIYREHSGNIELTEIATMLNLPDGTVRGWKNKDNWDDKINGTFQKKIRNVPKEKASKTNAKKPNNYSKKPKEKIEEKAEELTEKQRLFAEIYVRNFNATQAAIKAGYSLETAYHIGYENLNKPHVREYIEWLKELKKESLMLSTDDIVERYMKIAFADMTDFMVFGVEEVPELDILGEPIFDDEGNPKTTKRNYLNFHPSNQIDGGLICEISVGKQGSKIKLEDRQKALDWLARYFGMNPMDQHKKAFDNAKLEIDRRRLELEELKTMPEEEEQFKDDGFLKALGNAVGEVWDDAGS